jgi:hypothetical protein
MRPDVVGMAVPAEVVIGRQNVRAVGPDQPDEPASGLVEVGLPERAGVEVPDPAHHVRVAIAEVLPFRDTEVGHRRFELGRPDLAEATMVVRGVHLWNDDLPELAACAGDEDDTVAVADRLGHDAAGPDRLVVGVGVGGHEGEGHRGILAADPYLRREDAGSGEAHPDPVIGAIGSRLRLVMRQPAAGGPDAPGAGDAIPGGEALPEIDFVAYTSDERLSGKVRLDASRLSDMLNAHDEFVLVDALAERLPRGGSLVVSEILVRRDELPLVHASGPRGDRTMRIPTEPHRIVLRAGRYLVAGRLHSGPGEDPLASLRARRPMVPLTYATIEFRRGGDIVREPTGTIVVNREHVDWVRMGVPLADGAEVPWVPTRHTRRDEDHEVPGTAETAS